MTLAEGRELSELSLRAPKGWPGGVFVFIWAGIQGSAYSYRSNLSPFWQRTHPKLKALMSVSLAVKHWTGRMASGQAVSEVTTQAAGRGTDMLAFLP